MEAALGWIGELVSWFVSWLPHLGICRATHGGVKFVRGSKIKEIKPGLYLWWPITTEVETIKTARQTLNLTSQKLVTKDGRTVLINLVVVHTVEDVVKALVDTADYEDTSADVALEAATEIVTGSDFDRLRHELCSDVRNQLTSRCRSALRPFGLRVEKCRVTDFVETTVYSVDGVEVGGE